LPVVDVDRLLLAIDTSTEQVGLALYDGAWLSELSWSAGRHQTASLLGQLDHLLRINQLAVRHLKAIGITLGPGSFNGLRVGMSVAKALSYGLGLPLVGLVTLDVLAYPHTVRRFPIRAFVRAGRGRVVYADYHWRGGQWVRESLLRTVRAEQLVDGLTETTVLAGELDHDLAERFSRQPRVRVPPPSWRLLRPGWVAELAFERWTAGMADRLETLEPIYVHHGTVEVAVPLELREGHEPVRPETG
jgi:tRNA threonylcarbamoyladenosine biosynthesis protein TsaB